MERCKRIFGKTLSWVFKGIALATSPLLFFACTDNAIKGTLGLNGDKPQVVILSPMAANGREEIILL
jgi:hypothetical protein